MKTRHLYNYLAEVTTADVVADPSRPDAFTFNACQSIAEYFNKIVHKEIQITAQINRLIREAERSQDIKLFLIPYIDTVEAMFIRTETGTYTHRHLRIIPPPGFPSPVDSPPGLNTSISAFVEIQFSSLLRIKTILSETKPAPQLSYQFNDSATDLMEILNILYETQAITPHGSCCTKSVFFTAAFRLFGLTLPNSFFQQIAQTTRRHNPVKYLDELRQKYIRYLSENRGELPGNYINYIKRIRKMLLSTNNNSQIINVLCSNTHVIH